MLLLLDMAMNEDGVIARWHRIVRACVCRVCLLALLADRFSLSISRVTTAQKTLWYRYVKMGVPSMVCKETVWNGHEGKLNESYY